MALYDCLIIDDEAILAKSTCEYFNMFEVKSAWTETAAGAMEFLQYNTVQLILLDINLGDDSGFDLCKTLRGTTDVPILFISARTSNDDMLLALNIGGDDYIAKPYSLSVLLAKVKAVLKRYAGCLNTNTAPDKDLYIDKTTERIIVNGEAVELKNMEYKLIKYLLDNKGRVIGKNELFEKVWGDTITGDGTLNVHIHRLREKIEKDPNDPKYIKTVWGVGYLFERGKV